MEPVIVKLNDPFTFGDREISTLEISKPKAKHLRELPVDQKQWTGEHVQKLISGVTNEPPRLIGELSLVDFGNVMEALSPFLGNSPQNGS